MSSTTSGTATTATSTGTARSTGTDASSSPLSSAISSTISSAISSAISSTTSTSTSSRSTVKPTADPNENNGKAQTQEGVSIETFLASLAVAAIVFGVQVIAFVLIRKKLKRVYEPRTYLVPDKRKTPAPPAGFINWFKPMFNTATSDFISKSGLDAYFFLRYLLMLLKTFGIIALVILPILLPMNFVGGKGGDGVQGLDRFAWSNVADNHTQRYWAHLLLALVLIVVFCYTFYDEMRKYIRMRQMYLTSPQHRLKASATTVLVSGIPDSWLTVQKLLDLYDVFPGGIRNVWINRNYDDLQEKVDERDKLAKALEKAETELIVLAAKNHNKAVKKDPSAAAAVEPSIGERSPGGMAGGPGLSSGNPHQIPEHVRDKPPAEKSKLRQPTGFAKVLDPRAGINRIGHGVMGGVSAVTGGVGKFISGSDRHRDAETHPAEREPEDLGRHPAERFESYNSNDTQNSRRSKRGSTLMGIDASSPTERRHSRPLDSPVDLDGETRKRFWNRSRKVSDAHMRGEDDERPLGESSPTSPTGQTIRTIDTIEKKALGALPLPLFRPKENEVYPEAYNAKFADETWGEPLWKRYVKESERPTMTLPLVSWLPSLPLIGKKVDTITYCRREVARLNTEIEQDQQSPEKYPLMNSAFIQFNQQVAAHMACQAVSHHVPQHMSPRHIEVSPNDVVWGNMRMQWWERYIRSVAITAATGGLIIGWAFPVAFVGLISQINYLTDTIKWLGWIDSLPESVIGVISGVLPPLFLGILMAVLPMILRLFARIKGAHTGMAIEKSVQAMYFAFLFVQVFLVVSISSGITAVVEEISKQPFQAPEILAKNLPKASNFFFSYLLLQAFTVSGGALLQIVVLLINFVLAPLIDKTAREKFTRSTALTEIKWGTFFPVYTNLACIGIVYSVISPLILIFNVITFSLFWLVYRYNLLFVVNFRFDTGGLLFPRAINQLFTGLYVMEVCLVGLFFLVRDTQNRVACAPQGIIMVIATILTGLYQLTLNRAFGPLFTYLPITLEDDAALRDEEFAAEQDLARRKNLVPNTHPENDDLNEVLAAREATQATPNSNPIEMQTFGRRSGETESDSRDKNSPATLFADIADEIEDLTPEERDRLVARAFQHPAQRAKRPVIWIPRDRLGVSDDEIRRTMKMTDCVWISNEWAWLEGLGTGAEGEKESKGSVRVAYGRGPPDLDARDLVEL
ncbi:DUF221 domain protein [Geopyxis carbonaria]|nr:DUF221 domain protein [Geopyxis carbonaria]